MDPLITRIREELKQHADPELREKSQWFFKEGVLCYGMKAKIANGIAKKYRKEAKVRPKQEIHTLCEELFKSGYIEESAFT